MDEFEACHATRTTNAFSYLVLYWWGASGKCSIGLLGENRLDATPSRCLQRV